MTEQTSHTETPQTDATQHTAQPHDAASQAEHHEGHAEGEQAEASGAEERIAALEEKLSEMEDRWKRSEQTTRISGHATSGKSKIPAITLFRNLPVMSLKLPIISAVVWLPCRLIRKAKTL